MKEDIKMLCCIDCGGDLQLINVEIKNDVILHGVLACVSCGRRFPIIDGVGVFFIKSSLNSLITDYERQLIDKYGYYNVLDGGDNTTHEKVVAVAKNWEYQWEKVLPFDGSDLEKDSIIGPRLFWIYIPIDPLFVKNKIVFIACGGRGREGYHICKQNPSKVLIVEIGAEIYSISKLIPDSGKRTVLLRCDILNHPVKDTMVDISICDHALQHVLDYRLAFKNLSSATKSGGIVSICVYSYENNFIMTHIVEPLKWLFHAFPLIFQRGLAFIPAVIIYTLINLIYLPASHLSLKFKWVRKLFPLFDHMIFWSTSPFKIIWCACFDLIHAPISYHFKKSEVVDLAYTNKLHIMKLINTHGTTWSLVAEKLKEQ